MKKKNNILVYGYGRWAKIYINYLRKYKFKTYIFTRQKTLYKNYNFISKKDYLKKLNIKKIFIINKTSDHLESLEYFLSYKIPILIEKPLDHNIYNVKINTLKTLFFYHYNFHLLIIFLFKKKILKDNILKFDLIWHDKVGDKKYNEKMYFIEDVFYHFYSVISIFFNPKYFFIKKKKNLKISKSKISFEILNIKFSLKTKKNYIKKERILKITTMKNLYIVNFTKINDIRIYRDNKVIKKFKKNQELIKKQINFFIKDEKKINKNKLINLKILINNLKQIRNYLKV